MIELLIPYGLWIFSTVLFFLTCYQRDKAKKALRLASIENITQRNHIKDLCKIQELIDTDRDGLTDEVEKLEKQLAWYKRREEFKKMVEKAECDKIMKEVYEKLNIEQEIK